MISFLFFQPQSATEVGFPLRAQTWASAALLGVSFASMKNSTPTGERPVSVQGPDDGSFDFGEIFNSNDARIDPMDVNDSRFELIDFVGEIRIRCEFWEAKAGGFRVRMHDPGFQPIQPKITQAAGSGIVQMDFRFLAVFLHHQHMGIDPMSDEGVMQAINGPRGTAVQVGSGEVKKSQESFNFTMPIALKTSS